MKEMIEIEGVVIAAQKGKVVIEGEDKIYVVRNKENKEKPKVSNRLNPMAPSIPKQFLPKKPRVKKKGVRFSATEVDTIKKNKNLGPTRIAKLLKRPIKQVKSKMYCMTKKGDL